MSLRPADVGDAAALATLHATSFPKPWPEADFFKLMQAPGAFAHVADGQGFILCWAHADEGEVLTLAVAPPFRRQGLGGRLLAAALAEATARGAGRMVLEAAVDNAAALGLYAGFGFKIVGRRPAYYAGGQGASDAFVLAWEAGA